VGIAMGISPKNRFNRGCLRGLSGVLYAAIYRSPVRKLIRNW
jgi:hypothetical protein